MLCREIISSSKFQIAALTGALSAYSILSGLFISRTASRQIVAPNITLSKSHPPDVEVRITDHLPKTKSKNFNPSRSHPHAGARNPLSGLLGYIVDPNPERLVVSAHVEETLQNVCIGYTFANGPEGSGGYQVLQKVRSGVIESRQMLAGTETTAEGGKTRILCIVYTHKRRREVLQSVVDTWARQCDGFWAASDASEESLGALDLPHDGPEEYGNMWQKVRSAWGYAYDNYRDQFDYFHICGDDTYIVMDNLRAYLEGVEVQGFLNGTKRIFSIAQEQNQVVWRGVGLRPLLLGMPVDRNHHKREFLYETFPAGGCGYTLNRAALNLFAEKCLPDFLPNATSSMEDVYLGGCLASFGVHTADTRDALGAWRYHALDAEFQYRYSGKGAPWIPPLLKGKHRISSLHGLDGASRQSVAFHLKDPSNGNVKDIARRMYRYHALIQGLCNERQEA